MNKNSPKSSRCALFQISSSYGFSFILHNQTLPFVVIRHFITSILAIWMRWTKEIKLKNNLWMEWIRSLLLFYLSGLFVLGTWDLKTCLVFIIIKDVVLALSHFISISFHFILCDGLDKNDNVWDVRMNNTLDIYFSLKESCCWTTT